MAGTAMVVAMTAVAMAEDDVAILFEDRSKFLITDQDRGMSNSDLRSLAEEQMIKRQG